MTRPASPKVDFGKAERDSFLFGAAQLLGMECTCDDPECTTEMLRQVLALMMAAQAVADLEHKQQRLRFGPAFKGVFG